MTYTIKTEDQKHRIELALAEHELKILRAEMVMANYGARRELNHFLRQEPYIAWEHYLLEK